MERKLNCVDIDNKIKADKRERRIFEAITEDYSTIKTLQPYLLDSMCCYDSGILDIDYVKEVAGLGINGIDKLPYQLKQLRLQNIDIYNRISNTDYFELLQDERTFDDDSESYLELYVSLNENEDGITFKELADFINKDEMIIMRLIKNIEGFIELEECGKYGYSQMVLNDDFYVRLVPVVDEKNRLTKLKYQYLLKAKAIRKILCQLGIENCIMNDK